MDHDSETSPVPRWCGPRMLWMIIIALVSSSLSGQAESKGQIGCASDNGNPPASFEDLANEGLKNSRLGHYEVAAACYRRALAVNPHIAPVQLNLALAEFKLGHFAKAISPLQLVISMDSTNAQARALLGMSFYGASRFADAVEMLDPLLSADPRNARLRYILAQSCLWAAQYDRALREFEWLQREHPDSAATHILMAEALDGLGKEDEAMRELASAVRSAPAEPNVHFALGYLLWKARRYDDAEREFRAEIANDPAHARALAWLGDSLLQRDEAARALPPIENSLHLDASIRIAHLDRGIILADRKEYELSISELREAVRLDPSKSDAHFRLSRVYKEMGRLDEAKAEVAMIRRLAEQRAPEALVQVSGGPPRLPSP